MNTDVLLALNPQRCPRCRIVGALFNNAVTGTACCFRCIASIRGGAPPPTVTRPAGRCPNCRTIGPLFNKAVAGGTAYCFRCLASIRNGAVPGESFEGFARRVDRAINAEPIEVIVYVTSN